MPTPHNVQQELNLMYAQLATLRLNQLDDVQQSLEQRIGRTPTGVLRNILCDANIHLLEALRLLKIAGSQRS